MGGGDMGGHFTLVPVYSIFYLYCLFTFSSLFVDIINLYFWRRPNTQKYKLMMSTKEKSTLVNICKFKTIKIENGINRD